MIFRKKIESHTLRFSGKFQAVLNSDFEDMETIGENIKKYRNLTQIFVDELVLAHNDKILAIIILGSREGENDISISDIDFLIICKSKVNTHSVFETALQIQEKIFDVKTTKTNKFIQKFFLGSNSYQGIHLIILGRDELDKNFCPISFRLKFMTKLVGKNLFLYEIKQNHHLLYGKNFAEEIQINQPNFSEKLTCFVFPSIVLFSILPSIFFSRRTFKIWCFKAVKYHNISLRAFIAITRQNYQLDESLFSKAKFFRYKPDEYLENSLVLYLKVWKNIFQNLLFLFFKKNA